MWQRMLRGSKGWTMETIRAVESSISSVLFVVWCCVMVVLMPVMLWMALKDRLWAFFWRHCSICLGTGWVPAWCDCKNAPMCSHGHMGATRKCNTCKGKGRIFRWL